MHLDLQALAAAAGHTSPAAAVAAIIGVLRSQTQVGWGSQFQWEQGGGEGALASRAAQTGAAGNLALYQGLKAGASLVNPTPVCASTRILCSSNICHAGMRIIPLRQAPQCMLKALPAPHCTRSCLALNLAALSLSPSLPQQAPFPPHQHPCPAPGWLRMTVKAGARVQRGQHWWHQQQHCPTGQQQGAQQQGWVWVLRPGHPSSCSK